MNTPTPDRLDIYAQQKLLSNAMEILSHMASCDVLMSIDTPYYTDKRLEYENNYKQAIANLNAGVNGVPPEPLTDDNIESSVEQQIADGEKAAFEASNPDDITGVI
jgi:hypothetical protein